MQPMQNVDLPTKDGDMIEYEITIQWLGDSLQLDGELGSDC